ncbi:MAG: M23 family metallopeptidase, partial [Oscillospiraceae bacterium]
MATFTEIAGQMVAFVPVSYNREIGDYEINVKCGELEKNAIVKVKAHEFTRQDMTIDEGIKDDTADSAEANAEYRNKIFPLYKTADETTYWKGLFKQPVYGEITTQYGLRRYINGSKTPERHGGIDIAVPEGTPVPAPNAGRVVFAQFIKLTGNTVVIEHGAGVKSYFFHMSELNVTENQMVEQDDIIGKDNDLLEIERIIDKTRLNGIINFRNQDGFGFEKILFGKEKYINGL